MAKFIPQKAEKEVVSMRISTGVLAEIDRKAAQIGISRNELINQCISFALANMETDSEEYCRLSFEAALFYLVWATSGLAASSLSLFELPQNTVDIIPSTEDSVSISMDFTWLKYNISFSDFRQIRFGFKNINIDGNDISILQKVP